MVNLELNEFAQDHRLVRSETLARLRWIAVFGQFGAVIITYFYFQYDLPLWRCIFVISCSIVMNLVLQFPNGRWLNESAATWVLAFDSFQFASLVFLTGGLTNPFAMMSLVPVMIASSILSAQKSVIIGVLVIALSAILMKFHYPLPWDVDQPIEIPFLYVLALWLAIVVTVVFVGLYAWRVAQEGRQLARALAATELVLNREHHLSQLDGLAAAAAHELGTPLGTIALIAKELSNAAPEGSEAEEDLNMLREQVTRCRNILLTLTTFKDQQHSFFERVSIRQLMNEVVQNIYALDISTHVFAEGEGDEPICQRNPGVTYGLTNLLENAVDFAKSRIDVHIRWNNSHVALEIKDDGEGFPTEILHHIGKPYVTSRKRDQNTPEQQNGGLGLGLFISKTLIERTGACLSFTNAALPEMGAIVHISWPRAAFEQNTIVNPA